MLKTLEFPYLIMNLDQTSLKHIPAMNVTKPKQNSKSASIARSSHSRSIIGMFSVTLNHQFLPKHLIFEVKLSKVFHDSNFQMVSLTIAIPKMKLFCHMKKTNLNIWENQTSGTRYHGCISMM